MNSDQLHIDPNGVGQKGSLFGLPFTHENANLVIIPAPWDVTVSYAAGCSKGPRAILDASPQLDLYDENIENAWNLGIAMLDIPKDIYWESAKLRELAVDYIQGLEDGDPIDSEHPTVQLITEMGENLNNWIQETAEQFIKQGKMVATLGGDHSTPLGLMKALAKTHKDFGILQIDAHADLRDAYEGFKYSHASIMFNAIQLKEVSKLVQVGIRDYCQSEAQLSKENSKIVTFYDHDLKNQQYEGRTWADQCKEIVANLPQNVYISFDIDGFDPKLCPNTGTPVPGGFEFAEAVYLLKEVRKSGRKIIGFDLSEVAPGENEWDGNVGARILYKLCNFALAKTIL